MRLSRLWQWLSGERTAIKEPSRLYAAEHGIVKSHISENALTVLSTLQQNGFHAYLVGGSVRDLLMGITPKDFDIATNARPEQVKKLFRHCRLIGKRFRLAHVVFGRDIIEVATFRKAASKAKHHFRKNGHGMLVSDNHYGRIQHDVLRRDFTVNALYYNALDEVVIDYVDGVNDLMHGRFRIMGNPEVRYREDPVRMLRAIRLMSKLNLQPESATEKAIPELASLLSEISSTRLFEELLKMLYGGQALANVKLMYRYNLLQYMLPFTSAIMSKHGKLSHLDQLGLENTDNRINRGMSINPAFLLSVLLWSSVKDREQGFRAQKHRPSTAFRMAADAVLSNQLRVTSIPKRITLMIMEIWRMQYPLETLRHQQAMTLVQHKRFRAAYDFLILRAESGENLKEIADWWTQYQNVDAFEREAMVLVLSNSNPSIENCR